MLQLKVISHQDPTLTEEKVNKFLDQLDREDKKPIKIDISDSCAGTSRQFWTQYTVSILYVEKSSNINWS